MNRTQDFIEAVLARSVTKVARLVIVTHLAPGADVLLRALHNIIPIAAIIPKPNSIDAHTRQKLDGVIFVLNFSRSDIAKHTDALLGQLGKRIDNHTFAIIDTGGYFAEILAEVSACFGEKFAGIVEDTENGHQKYLRQLNRLRGKPFPCPVVSVARSDLKMPEDYLVGQAVVFSAEAQLREQGQILTGKRALVLGYGKIGRSIAQNLHCKSARVDVIDTSATRQVLALAHGHHTGFPSVLIAQADLIFCATGNISLTADLFVHIKKGAYIFTATSGDDEIENHASLLKRCTPCALGKMSVVAPDPRHPQRVRFYLCNNGNAVNFLNGGIVGDFIKLVQAEFIYAATQLPCVTERHGIQEVEDGAKQFIAKLWMQHFSN